MNKFLPKYANFGLTSESHGLKPFAKSEWNKTDGTQQSRNVADDFSLNRH